MPTQSEQLGTAFRAEVWRVHSEDSVGKTASDPLRKLVPALLQATQALPGASDCGRCVGIVGLVLETLEDLAAGTRYPPIAKSLACRDTQYLNEKGRKTSFAD